MCDGNWLVERMQMQHHFQIILARASASSKVNTVGVELLAILGFDDGCSVVGDSFPFLISAFNVVFAVVGKDVSKV